jgi:hypothetical protein
MRIRIRNPERYRVSNPDPTGPVDSESGCEFGKTKMVIKKRKNGTCFEEFNVLRYL